MKRLSTLNRRLLLAALVAFAAGTASASQVIVVTPTAGNPTQSGNDLLAALNGITDNAWGRRYLVLLEPGVYSLGDQNVQMKDYVDIAGSGTEATFVYGNGNTSDPVTGQVNRGLFQGAHYNELRDMTIRVYPTPERQWLVPILLTTFTGPPSSNTRVRNVRTNAFSSTAYCGGIVGHATTSLIEDVHVLSSCSGQATGIVFDTGILGGDTSSPTLRRVNVIASSSSTTSSAWGVAVAGTGAYPTITIEDSSAVAGGGSQATGLFVEPVGGGPALVVTDSTFTGQNATVTSRGASISGTSGAQLRHSRFYASSESGTSIGVQSTSALPALEIQNCLVSGDDNSVDGLAFVGDSKLAGGPVNGTITCAGVYDENFTFFTNTCP